MPTRPPLSAYLQSRWDVPKPAGMDTPDERISLSSLERGRLMVRAVISAVAAAKTSMT